MSDYIMEMYKIVLKSDTAFFRNDMTSTSYQESFNCPPLSTIHGLIASSYGEYCYDIDIGYVFVFESKCTDYELIIQKNAKYKNLYNKYMGDNRFDRNDILRGCMGTNPIKREVLFNCTLTMYIDNKNVAESFLKPYHALLLGRSEDLTRVSEKPKKIKLINPEVPFDFGKTIIPFEIGKSIPGRLSKMNIEISEEWPRKVRRAEIFNIVDKNWEDQIFYKDVKIDPELNLGIYIHKGKSVV